MFADLIWTMATERQANMRAAARRRDDRTRPRHDPGTGAGTPRTR